MGALGQQVRLSLCKFLCATTSNVIYNENVSIQFQSYVCIVFQCGWRFSPLSSQSFMDGVLISMKMDYMQLLNTHSRFLCSFIELSSQCHHSTYLCIQFFCMVEHVKCTWFGLALLNFDLSLMI
jgi:hypothetical protein